MKLKFTKPLKLILLISLLIFIVALFFRLTNFNLENIISSGISLEKTTAETENPPKTTIPLSYVTEAMKIQAEISKLQAIPTDPQPVSALKITGWIPDWDLADGFTTLQNFSSEFYSISPFWLMPQDTGNINVVANDVNPEISQFSSNNGIKLIPTVPLFDSDLFSKIFESPDGYSNFVNDLMADVENNNYDGVDLDFEEIKFTDNDLFYKLLNELATKLHSENKVLVFTAIAKWGNEINYNGHPQTRAVQDYKKISDIVDELRIMTYDFYGRDSSSAGPIAPLEWMERVIQYAIYSGVPRGKIVLGVPTYSYDWSDRAIADHVDLTTDYTGLGSLFGLEPGDAYYNIGVEKVIANYDLQYSFNDIWGEAIGRYLFEGKSRIVIFPTDKSIELRKELAAKYGIKGIAFWRLGDEGNLKL